MEQDSATNKNRNRFAKKKLPSALRSQSVDLKDTLAATMDDVTMDSHHTIKLASPVRPNLTRQNAFARGGANTGQGSGVSLQPRYHTTKSLSENLNYAHCFPALSPPSSSTTSHQHQNDPSKPPKISQQHHHRLLAKLTSKHSDRKYI